MVSVQCRTSVAWRLIRNGIGKEAAREEGSRGGCLKSLLDAKGKITAPMQWL